MNTFFMPATTMLAMTEGAGGLFDFNATLPLMAIQFVLLMVVLTFIFYILSFCLLDHCMNL